MTARDTCYYPASEDHPSGLPEGFDEWRAPDGLCSHEDCLEGNRIGRLYASAKSMSRDEIEALKADRELIRDEYAGVYR